MIMCMSDVIAVTNRRLCTRPFLEQLERVCRLRPEAVILREKDLPETEYERLAAQVMEVCERHQVRCILHTYTGAARRLGGRAIHLPLPLLREQAECLDGFETVGVSIHAVGEAAEAQRLGASYVTAGHIYATDCKKGVPPRGLEFLRQVCGSVDIPVYAIGGIGLEKGQLEEVKACGARGGCVMSGMMRV